MQIILSTGLAVANNVRIDGAEKNVMRVLLCRILYDSVYVYVLSEFSPRTLFCF